MIDAGHLMENFFIRLAKKAKNLVVLSPDSTVKFGLSQFSKFFDERHFTFGLGGANMFSAAAGFTVRGKTPLIVCDSECAFSAVREINQNICIPNLNVKILVFDFSGNTADLDAVKSFSNIKINLMSSDDEIFDNIESAFDDFGPCYLRISDSVSK